MTVSEVYFSTNTDQHPCFTSWDGLVIWDHVHLFYDGLKALADTLKTYSSYLYNRKPLPSTPSPRPIFLSYTQTPLRKAFFLWGWRQLPLFCALFPFLLTSHTCNRALCVSEKVVCCQSQAQMSGFWVQETKGTSCFPTSPPPSSMLAFFSTNGYKYRPTVSRQCAIATGGPDINILICFRVKNQWKKRWWKAALTGDRKQPLGLWLLLKWSYHLKNLLDVEIRNILTPTEFKCEYLESSSPCV